MMNNKFRWTGLKIIRLLFSSLLLLAITPVLLSQEPPPRPISVTPTLQVLSFGTFSQGPAGGSVTITASGVRTASPGIIPLTLNPTFSPALYEVVGNPGTLVSLLEGSTATLSGSNGGTMQLTISGTNPSPLIITTLPPSSTLMYVGGILTVGVPGSNPPGTYSGTFNITLIQE